MRNTYAVYIRELRSYFFSPIFYIVGAVFVMVVGNYFKDGYFEFAERTMRLLQQTASYGGSIPLINVSYVAANTFTFLNFVFLLIVPLLTMRLYAEEKKNGTMELLMTSPITTVQVLIGKFLSCWTIYTLLMILTIAFNIIMDYQSQGKLDWGLVMSSYLGTFLFGSAIISIGMFFSSLTENQVVAAAMSLTFIMAMWLLVYSARFLDPPFSYFISYISLNHHLDSFNTGFIGIGHIVYYLSTAFFWLFMTGITVESARWRQ